MGKWKGLSDFDKGQIVMARRLGQSISKTACLVGCSLLAVVSTHKNVATKDNRWTGVRVMGAQGSVLLVGSKS